METTKKMETMKKMEKMEKTEAVRAYEKEMRAVCARGAVRSPSGDRAVYDTAEKWGKCLPSEETFNQHFSVRAEAPGGQKVGIAHFLSIEAASAVSVADAVIELIRQLQNFSVIVSITETDDFGRENTWLALATSMNAANAAFQGWGNVQLFEKLDVTPLYRQRVNAFGWICPAEKLMRFPARLLQVESDLAALVDYPIWDVHFREHPAGQRMFGRHLQRKGWIEAETGWLKGRSVIKKEGGGRFLAACPWGQAYIE